MDFSPHRRRHSRLRNTYHYSKKSDLTPFLVIFGSAIVGVLLFLLVKALFLGDRGDLYHPSFFSEVGSHGEIQLKQNDDWQFFSHAILLWEGDKVRSLMGNEVWVKFEDQLEIFLSPLAIIELIESRITKKESTSTFALHEGEVWIEVPYTMQDTSRFSIELGEQLLFESTGGTIITSLESVRVLSENGGINTLWFLKDGKKQFSTSLSIGQEVVLTPSALSIALQNERFTLQPISPEFYLSSLYQDRTKTQISPEIAKVVGDISLADVENEETGTDSDLFWDQVATITSPGKTSSTVEVSDPYQKIMGIAPPDTQKIYVRYKDEVHILQKFEPGQETWTYLARPDFDNLEEGANTYEVVVENKNRERSKPVSITLEYTPVPTGVLSITTPNKGNDGPVYAAPQWLKGTAPSNAAYIRINNYTLQKFVKGDPTWNYYAADLTKGPNIFTVTALDTAKNVVDSKTITLFYTDPNTTITTPEAAPTEPSLPSTTEVSRDTSASSSSVDVSTGEVAR